MVRLSAFVCVQNQETMLGECLRRLSFCDEIVVVADRCTDGSQDIARRAGALVIDGIFPLESQRKAAGAEACTGQWILEIDPDEIVDAALAWEIRAVLQMRPVGDYYQLPIDNYIGDTLIREGWSGRLSTRCETRLYRRGSKAWEARRVNAGSLLAGRSGGALTGAIRRKLGADLGGLVERLNRVSALAAEDLADAGIPSVAASLTSGVGAFLTGFVVRGGWREGRLGLMTATLSGLLPVLSQIRASDVLKARAAAEAEAAQPQRLRRVVGLAGR